MVQLLYCILYLYCLFLHTSEFECSSVKLKCSENKVEIRSKIIVNYLPISILYSRIKRKLRVREKIITEQNNPGKGL